MGNEKRKATESSSGIPAKKSQTMLHQLQNMRRWENTSLAEQMARGSFFLGRGDVMFTVMTYNVLADVLRKDHPHLYQECNSKYLDWDYRKEGLKREFTTFSADVVCLQEVQDEHYTSFFEPMFREQGYKGYYKQRTGKGFDDGCALFVKEAKFSVSEIKNVEYYHPNVEVLDRHNVAIVARLKAVTGGAEVCIGTTHLLYNPNRHDVKLAQVQYLFAELDRLAYRENGYVPIIITGDFNLVPRSPVYDFISSGQFKFEGLYKRSLGKEGGGSKLGRELIPHHVGITNRCLYRHLEAKRHPDAMRFANFEDFYKAFRSQAPDGILKHGFNLRSVYSHSLTRRPGGEEATAFQKSWDTVDYIFYSNVPDPKTNGLMEGPLKLVAKYGLLSTVECSSLGRMPNAACPSDHFPIVAKFLLKKT